VSSVRVSGPVKILVLGGNHAVADALTSSLQSRHYEVLLAATPDLGIALAKAERPDLILMDANPRAAGGWDAAALLKSAPETSHIPVIVVGAGVGANERLLDKIETLLTPDPTGPTKNRPATDR
jgi:two-component system, cell cycle response regulator DivK